MVEQAGQAVELPNSQWLGALRGGLEDPLNPLQGPRPELLGLSLVPRAQRPFQLQVLLPRTPKNLRDGSPHDLWNCLPKPEDPRLRVPYWADHEVLGASPALTHMDHSSVSPGGPLDHCFADPLPGFGSRRKGLPGEGFEPPTFGLQNRCTTTVLTRHIVAVRPDRSCRTSPRTNSAHDYVPPPPAATLNSASAPALK